MSQYFLGVDVGGTKTHALVADGTGQALGFGKAGTGNHEAVGYDGLRKAISKAAGQALAAAGLSQHQLAGAGFGVGGCDWPSEKPPTTEVIRSIGIQAPIEVVNDTLLGLMAGSVAGWGVAVVAGTGCNCWGWDQQRRRIGQVTGAGSIMGEGAGSGELVAMSLQKVAHEWTRRGPATQLTPALVQFTGASDLPDMLEGLVNNRYVLTPAAAPLIFQTAAAGDAVALDLIRWAGQELGELANAVIRQLDFQEVSFEVVQVGSMYAGSPLLSRVMEQTILSEAPRARLVHLTHPPVAGAVLLGMEAAGFAPTPWVRTLLTESARMGFINQG